MLSWLSLPNPMWISDVFLAWFPITPLFLSLPNLILLLLKELRFDPGLNALRRVSHLLPTSSDSRGNVPLIVNRISALRESDGTIVSDTEGICGIISSFYSPLFSCEPINSIACDFLLQNICSTLSPGQAASSFYELPDGGSLQFTEVPVIQLPSKTMPVAEEKVLRNWRDNYGQPGVQVTVRNQTMKDNVGTLPLYSYTRPQPSTAPLINFSQ